MGEGLLPSMRHAVSVFRPVGGGRLAAIPSAAIVFATLVSSDLLWAHHRLDNVGDTGLRPPGGPSEVGWPSVLLFPLPSTPLPPHMQAPSPATLQYQVHVCR